ncbi:amphi-Trp domain-containing protein [Halosolutus halophilus]|uniref:amphi-Trp domain-containing protein n=1 Tax=Halosolutus halophilus TaxID=1552990 RepID=UPI0022350175|nr:amphi-Trp domain-containing protein [Halosolutus halophilus]
MTKDVDSSFLREIADALEHDTSPNVSGSTWEIPFVYRDPIEAEIEFAKRRTTELEIELEFERARVGSDLNVE